MQHSNTIKTFLTGIFLVSFLSAPFAQQKTPTRDPHLYKLYGAARTIILNYVDTVDKQVMVEGAIKGMLEDLDPHSSYLTAEQVKRANEPLKGNFKGVGIEFNILKDTLMVVAVIEGGPSERAGLRPGDRILSVDGENIAGVGLKNKDVVDKLRGEAGSVVALNIMRRGAIDLLPYEITRGTIPIFSVDASFMVDKRVGYIKINRFSATTYKEFVLAMKKLKKQGMKKLILDLQGNGGGYLGAAIALADELIKKDNLIVYTESRFSRSDKYAEKRGMFEKNDMVVLVDESSASASEILSGAIQDWDRGVIIGRRTFGKGLVQRPYPLPDGSEIRLTIARYYTPSGRSIQKPYENGRADYRKDLQKRIEHGELFYADSIEFPDSLKYKTLKSERNVYGGGGIMPDIFVPLDTAYYSDFFRRLNRSGILNRFTLDHVDNNRDELIADYPLYSEFEDGFMVSDELYQQMVQEAKRDHIEYTEESEVSDTIIKLQIKALMARYLYGRGHFYQVMKVQDPIFEKALKILSDEDQYSLLLNGRN